MKHLDLFAAINAPTPSDVTAAFAAAYLVNAIDPVHALTVAQNLESVYGLRLLNEVDIDGKFSETFFDSDNSADDFFIEIEEEELNGVYINATVFFYNGSNYVIVFYIDEEESAAWTVFSTEEIIE